MGKDIFSYEVTDDNLKLQISISEKKGAMAIDAMLPAGYTTKYNFLRVVFFASAIKKEFNKKQNDLSIKQLFFGLLKNLPGDISEYPFISLAVGEDKISISEGQLMEYYDSKTDERIFSSSSILDVDDESTTYSDYNYYLGDKNSYICFCDILTDPYCMYPEEGLSPHQGEAYSKYVKGIIDSFNTEIKEYNKTRKKKR